MRYQAKTCEHCKKSIKNPTSANQRYHPECYKLARAERERLRIANIRGSKTERACRNCGTTFKPERSGQRYCCTKCRWEYNNRAASRKTQRITKPCIECGVEFVTLAKREQERCRACRKRQLNRERYTKQEKGLWDRKPEKWFVVDPFSSGLRVPGLGLVTACPEVCPMEPWADSWVDAPGTEAA